MAGCWHTSDMHLVAGGQCNSFGRRKLIQLRLNIWVKTEPQTKWNMEITWQTEEDSVCDFVTIHSLVAISVNWLVRLKSFYLLWRHKPRKQIYVCSEIVMIRFFFLFNFHLIRKLCTRRHEMKTIIGDEMKSEKSNFKILKFC